MSQADVGSNPTLTARAGISNGRVAAGTVEIYVGTGCVISQSNSDCQQKKQKIDIKYCKATKTLS